MRRCCNGKEAEKLIAFAAGRMDENEAEAAFVHLLSCPACQQTLLAMQSPAAEPAPGELARMRMLSDRLLTKFMRADAGRSWDKLSDLLTRLVAVLSADVLAAARGERVTESIFFRSLAANDHPDYWLAELLLPEGEASSLRLKVSDAAGRPLGGGTLVLCGLPLPVIGGECLIDLLEFQRNLHQKNVSFHFPNDRVSPGVPLFFEDVGV